MVRDVFVSHASNDSELAVRVCELLEQRGLTCWIAPRDVGAGVEWDEAILDAIEESRAFLLMLSEHANQSAFVKNELNRAFSGGKPIVTFRMEEVTPGRSLELYLARHHWTDAFPPPLEPRVEQLANSLVTLLGQPASVVQKPAAPAKPVKKSVPSAGGARVWMAVAAVAVLAAIAFAIPALKHLRETPPPETRFEIPIPDTNEPMSALALSPDGRLIVYGAGIGNDARLWLRPLGMTTAQPLAGTEGASFPFWSPDSRSIGFFANGALKRLDLGGGAPLTLVPTDARFGGTWNAEGIILFSRGQWVTLGQPTSIAQVAATGGAVTEIPLLDAKAGSHAVPVFLPDGRRFLFGYVGSKGTGTYLGSLDGKPPVQLTPGAGPIAYLPSGWLLVSNISQRVLVAQRLDADTAKLVGEPVTLAQGRGSVSAAPPGFLAFRNTSVDAGERQLVWRHRTGGELGTFGEPDRTYNSPRVSPDGKQIVVARGEAGKQDIWLLDGVRSTRVTFESADNAAPAWSPDGSRITYSVQASEGRALHLKPVNGLGEAERLSKNDLGIWPTSWSRDGRFLLYVSQNSTTKLDIGVLRLAGDRKPSPLVDTSSIENWGQFSPDGKWVAYQSDASAERNEIFVRPFVKPDTRGAGTATGGRWQASVAGGIHPMWSPDGKELFYLNPLGEMMAVPIAVNGSALEPGRPMKLFQARILNGGVDAQPGRQYDVAPDGRFLINQVSDTSVAPITLVQNWNPDAGK